MDEEIPSELTTKISSLLKTITNAVRCSACGKIICEPQKGSCAHNACAKCWGLSSRKCKICSTNSGVQLAPNSNLARRVAAIMKLVKSFQEWSQIDILSTNSSDTETSNQLSHECFYDSKYINQKTYKGKDTIDMLVVKKKEKVGEWLSSLDNQFDNIPRKTRKTKRQSTDENKNSVHDLEKNSDNSKAKTLNKSNESVPGKSDDKIKAGWLNVKKCKKTLQKGKKGKKKLSVSVESCTKNNSNTDNDPASSFHIIEDVPTPKCENFVKTDLSNENINKNHAGTVSKVETVEYFSKSVTISDSQKPHTTNIVELSNIYPFAASTKIKNVPFFLNGRLSRKNTTKSRVPFDFHIANVSDKWRTTTEGGLNIKIQRGNTTTSILIKDENFAPVTKKTIGTQTSLEHFPAEICAEIEQNSVVVPEIENDVQPLSENDLLPPTFSDSIKRSRSDTSIDNNCSHVAKKNKLSISDMPLDDDMVICFDSQSQLFPSEEVNKSIISIPKSPVSSKISSEKLEALKKSVKTYIGYEDDVGGSQIPVGDSEKPRTPFSVIEGDVIVEDTPQKSRTKRIMKRNSMRNSAAKENVSSLNPNISRNLRSRDVSKEKNDSDMDETLVCESSNNLNEKKSHELGAKKKIITPSSINKFKHDVKHQSTPLQPLAKRSLTYDGLPKFSTIGEAEEFDEKQSLTRSRSIQPLEEEFIKEAFGADLNKSRRKSKRVCLVCSLLSVTDKTFVAEISTEMGWDHNLTFTQDLTHLIVKVDANNRTQRTEKYIRALATGCWIVSFEWIEQCIKAKCHVPEDAFEVLDSSGERGPYLMRTSKTKIFRNITFYLLPPFQLLPIGVIEEILLITGGKVVKTMEEAFVTDPNKISVVLVEPKDTEDERPIDLCLQHHLVPINMEWVLECLGRGSRKSLCNWILCQLSMLPKINWPEDLFAEEDELDESSQH